jgi:hypothetical protein
LAHRQKGRPDSDDVMHSSGKLVIIGIVTVALAAAAASWWFRYAATHRAADFWGPHTTRLIRDAPTVELFQFAPPTKLAPSSSGAAALLGDATARDLSRAPGLIHLRNALLEDRSYRWPPQPMRPNDRWQWALRFRARPSDDAAILFFSPDWTSVGTPGRNEILSCQPIAAGLTEMLGEFAPAHDTPR